MFVIRFLGHGKESGYNGVNEEILIDVAYAALRINAETYRAKITFKRYMAPNVTCKAYAYHNENRGADWQFSTCRKGHRAVPVAVERQIC